MTIFSSIPSDLCISILCEWCEVVEICRLDATFTLSNCEDEILKIYNIPNFYLANAFGTTNNWVCFRNLCLKVFNMDISMCFLDKHLLILVNPSKIEELQITTDDTSNASEAIRWDIKRLLVCKINQMTELNSIHLSYCQHPWYHKILERVSPQIWQQLTSFSDTTNHHETCNYMPKLAQYCENLTRLALNGMTEENDLLKMIKNNRKLTDLTLSNCAITTQVMEDIARYSKDIMSLTLNDVVPGIPLSFVSAIITKCPKLEYFQLCKLNHHNLEYSAEPHMPANEQDKTIHICNENNKNTFYSEQELVDFFSENVDFYHIKCDYFLTFSRRVIDTIVAYSPNARIIRVGDCSVQNNTHSYVLSQIFSKFPKLVYFTLSGATISNCELAELFKLNNTIIELNICYNLAVTCETVVQILENCLSIQQVRCFDGNYLTESELTTLVQQFCVANNRHIKLLFLDEGFNDDDASELSE